MYRAVVGFKYVLPLALPSPLSERNQLSLPTRPPQVARASLVDIAIVSVFFLPVRAAASQTISNRLAIRLDDRNATVSADVVSAG